MPKEGGKAEGNAPSFRPVDATIWCITATAAGPDPKKQAAYYLGAVLTLAGSLPQLYVLFLSSAPGRFTETYLPGTAAALVGLALYTRSLGRPIIWTALAVFNPYGPLFTFCWLHPAVKDPRVRLLLPLLLAYGLGYDLVTFRGEYARLSPFDLQALALYGIILGLVDPTRGATWAAALLLPSFVQALRVTLGIGQLDVLVQWTTDMAFPMIHAAFGGHIGRIAGWLVTRFRQRDEPPAYSAQRLAFVVLGVVVVGGLDPFVSIIYGGSLRLQETWVPRVLTGVTGVFIGLPLGQALLGHALTRAGQRVRTIEDHRGLGEWLAWCGLLLVIGMRRMVFETCAAMGSGDFTRCLDVADFPALASVGLAVGVIAGMYRRAAEHGAVLMIQLGRLEVGNRSTAIATLVFACVNMGMGSFEMIPPTPPEPGKLNRIAFVPLGTFPTQTLDDLAAYYRRSFGVTVDVLPPVALERWTFTYQREQLTAEAVTELMQRRHRAVASDPTRLVIGFAPIDMHSCHAVAYGLPYCDIYQDYALDAKSSRRLAVISSYRLDPVRYGESHDEERAKARLRKLSTRAIRLLYYQEPLSKDPHSVLFPATRPHELDVMTEGG